MELVRDIGKFVRSIDNKDKSSIYPWLPPFLKNSDVVFLKIIVPTLIFQRSDAFSDSLLAPVEQEQFRSFPISV